MAYRRKQKTSLFTLGCKDNGENDNIVNIVDSNVSVKIISNEEHSFIVKRATLIRKSDYFEGLFGSGMKESQTNEVGFPTLSTEGLKNVIDYMETGYIELPEEIFHLKIHDIVEAATYLQICELCEECKKVLEQALTMRSGIDYFDEYLLIAEKFDFVETIEYFHKWAFENGDVYLKSLSFLNKDIDNACTFLSNDNLFTSDEEIIFKAAIEYSQHHVLKGTEHDVNKLFKCIRFVQMSDTALLTCKTIYESLPLHSKEIMEIIVKSIEYHEEVSFQYEDREFLNFKPRCPINAVFACGGFLLSNRSTNKTQLMDTKALSSGRGILTYKINTKMKVPSTICEHSACLLDNYVYVVGGQVTYCQDGKTTSNNAYRFDLSLGKWSSIKAMNETRSLFYMCVLENRIYAVSGWLKPDTVTRTVEVYNPKFDQWTYDTSLEIGTHEHAGTVMNGQIYISGGYKGPLRGHLNRCWKFKPGENESSNGSWKEIASMNKSRSYHVMIAVDGKLLVVGGVQYHYDYDGMEDIRECELYDQNTNQWSIICNIPIVASCMPHVIVDKKLFLFGGHCFDDNAVETMHNNVQILDLDNFEWALGCTYTANRANFFTTVLVQISRVLYATFK